MKAADLEPVRHGRQAARRDGEVGRQLKMLLTECQARAIGWRRSLEQRCCRGGAGSAPGHREAYRPMLDLAIALALALVLVLV